VYFVFLPSIFTTSQAARLAGWIGVRHATWAGLGLAMLGVGLMAQNGLVAVLVGMTVVAVGTFLAQALTTGFVSRAAMEDRAAASGLYLASYFSGGLAGAVILGQVYTRYGWHAMLLCVALVLVGAVFLARNFDLPNAA
jgi:MFS transporter, YNFM family, putative membrane transport protein